MTSNEFSIIEQEWYDMQHSVLGAKADEYATEDRLHNFKAISDLTRGKVTPLQVAMILRGKQVISLYDRVFSDEPVSEEFFNEKAGDDANYLVLAKALHAEAPENNLLHQPKNLINVITEELIRNSKHYATMETDAEREAFIAARTKQIMNDMFPSMKKKKEQSENKEEPKMVMPMHYNQDTDTYSYWSEKYQQWFHDIDKMVDENSRLRQMIPEMIWHEKVQMMNGKGSFYEQKTQHAEEMP